MSCHLGEYFRVTLRLFWSFCIPLTLLSEENPPFGSEQNLTVCSSAVQVTHNYKLFLFDFQNLFTHFRFNSGIFFCAYHISIFETRTVHIVHRSSLELRTRCLLSVVLGLC